jgi:hypothetical protein
MSMEYKSIVESYVSYFESKNLKKIEELFTPNIVLYDSKIGVTENVENVIKVYSDLFNSFDKIKVSIKNLLICELKCYLEFKIILDGETAEIIDVIQFNNEGLIESIKVYFY